MHLSCAFYLMTRHSHKTTRFLAVPQLRFNILNPAKVVAGTLDMIRHLMVPNGSLVFGQLDLNLQLLTGHQWSLLFVLCPPNFSVHLPQNKFLQQQQQQQQQGTNNHWGPVLLLCFYPIDTVTHGSQNNTYTMASGYNHLSPRQWNDSHEGPPANVHQKLPESQWTATRHKLKLTLTTTYILKSLIQTNAECPVIEKPRLNKKTT